MDLKRWLILFVLGPVSARNRVPDDIGHLIRHAPPGTFPSPPARVRRDPERVQVRFPPLNASEYQIGPALTKRAVPDELFIPGEMFNYPGCLICPTDVPDNGPDMINYLNTNRMVSKSRYTSNQLRDRCVFYTKVLFPSIDLPGEGDLSTRATRWACARNRRSIWHLWSNKFDAPNAGLPDYYCLGEPGTCWLNPILSVPNLKFTYFENMSEAMARMCTGEIVVMSLDPYELSLYETLPYLPNIWANKERPELRNHRGTVTRLIGVHPLTNQAWEVDLDNVDSVRPIPPLKRRLKTRYLGVWNESMPAPPADMEDGTYHARMKLRGRELEERDDCPPDGLGTQPKDTDWFG